MVVGILCDHGIHPCSLFNVNAIPANGVWGKVKFSEACVKNSVHRGRLGGIPVCIVGGIPACLAVGLRRRVSSGGVSPGPHPRGKLRGIWSRPTPRGEVEGDLARVGCVLLWDACSGGCLLQGGLLWGDACSQENGDPLGTATAAGSTHSTGMHSCIKIISSPNNL